MSTNTQITAPPTAPTTASIPIHHEITISVQGNNAVPPNPIPTMAVGETVLYKSPQGEVRIQFTGRSPFRTDGLEMTSVPGAVILRLQSGSGDGFLECRCFITLPDGQEIGWGPNSLLSGGHHKVTPPN